MDVNKLMQKSVSHFETVISKIRAGKATTGILSDIYVNSYNTNVPLEQVANVSTPDARTISIQPWERNMIGAIEKAILASNIGLTPQNDGNYIKLFLPPLTEERRKELVKKVFAEGEEAKIAIRNHRRDCIEVYTDEQKKVIKKIAKGFSIYFEGWKEHKANDDEPDYETLLIHNQKTNDDFCLEILFQEEHSIFVVDSYNDRDIIFENYEEFIEYLPKIINDYKL